MMMHKVKPLMTRRPVIISPEATLEEAARKMEEIDCGILPVGTDAKPEGIITDRDIVIRAVSRGKDVRREKVRDYMTARVFSCSEEDSLEDAADQMKQYRVNRLVVTDSLGRISGIISIGGILRKSPDLQEINVVLQHALGRRAA